MLEQYDAKEKEPVKDKHDIDGDEGKIKSLIGQDSTATVPVQANTVLSTLCHAVQNDGKGIYANRIVCDLA